MDERADVTLSGEEEKDLISLASGTVAYTATHGSPDTPTMHMASAPCWTGYGPLLHGTKRVVSAEARTTVWIASLPKSKVIPLLKSRPGWWRPCMKLMAIHGDLASLIADDLRIQKSDLSFAAVLLRFAGVRLTATPRVAPISVPVTQEELAAASNMSRNSAAVILRRFASLGLVETSYGGIDILDPVGLRMLLQRG